MGRVRFPVQARVPRQKFMNLVKVKCVFCNKKFFKSVGRVNEAKKFGWKAYCSIMCQSKAKNKQQLLKCSNPKCHNTFQRQLSDIRSSNTYCSRSCAVSVNNSKFPKRKAPIKICLYCGITFKAIEQGVYCSRKCKDRAQVIGKDEILTKIKEFYKRARRIPLKEEFPHYNAAQERFGSWNKAIKAAGFETNPVKFSKKFIAKDGHKCNSFAEKIIDNWLSEKRIEHRKEVPYPEDKSLRADFITKNNWIEYFGLAGVISDYDKLIKKKRRLCEKYKLSLIEIYPKDLFPVNHLSEIIRIKNT